MIGLNLSFAKLALTIKSINTSSSNLCTIYGESLTAALRVGLLDKRIKFFYYITLSP